MRKEQELNRLDVHARAIRAAERVGPTNGLQEMLDSLQGKPKWWERWFKWETLTVAGRTVEKGWVIPQQLGIALIVLALSGATTMYWYVDHKIEAGNVAMREQRDVLVEIRTELKLTKEHDTEHRLLLKDQLDEQRAYYTSLNNQVYALKGMLTPDQLRRLEMAAKPVKLQNQ